MEHPFKRRRVERRRVSRPETDNTIRDRRQQTPRWAGHGDHVESQHTPPINGEAASPILGSIRPESETPSEPVDLAGSILELRQVDPTLGANLGNQVKSIVQPVQTGSANVVSRADNVAQPVHNPVATVINAAVSDGKDVVSRVVEPVVSQVAAVPGYGALTVPTSSGPTNLPGLVIPLPAVAAAEARTEALASQVAQAKELAASAASQIPLSIQVPGASSQHVLSSPPTPLPSTPHTTPASISYFSSSTTSPSKSPRPNTSSAPAMSSMNHNAPNSRNSTMTATSSNSNTATQSGSSSMTSSFNSADLASQASVSSLEALTASLTGSQASNSLVAATQSTQNPTASANANLSTFITMTSSSTRQSTSASSAASSSGVGPGVGGAGNTATAPSATSSSGSGSGGGTYTPPTPVLVGGIVGGIAGLVMILLIGLLLLRWRKGKLGQRREISLPVNPRTLGPGGTETMTERSSTAPIAAAGFFGRLRPSSSQTAATTDTAPSERGFQKISGRKLTSVLTSGGDGYGDAPAGPTAPPARGIAPGKGPFAGLAPALRPSPPHSLSGSSFYRDSQGFYGGLVPNRLSDPTGQAASPPSSSPSSPPTRALGSHPPQVRASPSPRSEIANMRPGPARTPTIHQPGFVPVRTPSRAQPPPPRPVRATPPPTTAESTRPTLGRSLTSQDGSRSSRFQESTTPP